MARKPTHHIIVHNGVGPFTQGTVVANDEWPEGTDLERLVNLGAIAPLSPAQAEEMLEPDDPTMGGTFDPLRTENPPTLPRPTEEGVPEHTIPVGQDKEGHPKAMSAADVRREARRRP